MGSVPPNDARGYCLPCETSPPVARKKNRKEKESEAFLGADRVVLKLLAAAAAAAAVHPGLWGWPGLLCPLPPQERPWKVLEGRWERNRRANSELAEQTAADGKHSGPALLKLSKQCVSPAAGSGACPSHRESAIRGHTQNNLGRQGRVVQEKALASMTQHSLARHTYEKPIKTERKKLKYLISSFCCK